MGKNIKFQLMLKSISVVSFSVIAALLTGCEGSTGFQGGSIPVDFTGIESAIGVSPKTIKLSWMQYPGSNKYSIYIPDTNAPLAENTFTTFLYAPPSPDSSKVYRYAVTAKSPSSGLEVGSRTNYVSVQLLPHFNFQSATSTVTAVGKNVLSVSWQAYPSVDYKVYVAKREPTGAINYNSFVSPTTTVNGLGNALIAGLEEGHDYCAIVVASYLDSYTDGPDGVLFSGDIGTTLSSDAYMKSQDTKKTFSGSIIAQSQKCARTQSDFDVATLKVLAPKATFTNKPVFYVTDPTDLIEGDNVGRVLTEIYKYDDSSTAVLVGDTRGSGKVTAREAIPQGRYKFFAVATDTNSAARPQAVVEIAVGLNAVKPDSDQKRQFVYIRSFGDVEDPNNLVGYYPEKQQAGSGAQHEGQSVAIGDFNCDGKKDIAIGIPDASVVSSNDSRPSKQGKVIIYYDVGNGTTLNYASTDGNKQEITFDISAFAGDSARNLRLGTKLIAANFNKDNQVTNQNGDGLNPNFQCDDLAIGSGYGPLFVLYGKRGTVANPVGGLNYLNPTTIEKNPGNSCDPSTGLCQPAMFYNSGSIMTQVGTALTVGDFDGDGYNDLVATSTYYGSPRGVWVFRASQYGLTPPRTFVDAAETITTGTGNNPGFPYIPITVGSHTSTIPDLNIPNAVSAMTAEWGASNFGISVTSFHNSYYDYDALGTTSKGTHRVRDTLIIGNPNSNLANVCIPKTNTTKSVNFSNGMDGLYWDCSTLKINAPDASATSFGYAMTDIKNALRYDYKQFTETGCELGFGNCQTTTDTGTLISSVKMGFPGAIAISSLNTGKTYLYYMVAKPSSALTTTTASVTNRDAIGVAKNAYLTHLLTKSTVARADATVLSVTSSVPCSNVGTSPNYYEYCDIQEIKAPSLSSNNYEYFGQVVSAFPGSFNDTIQPKDTILAIAAPNKGISLSGDSNYSNVGTVQLFSQHSVFISQPFVLSASIAFSTTDSKYKTCDTDAICRYSDGFSNALTTAIDYDGKITNNIYFGLGGIVGGPLTAGTDNYSSNSDIVVGVPGYVAESTTNGFTSSVIDNGAALAYWSHGGNYRTFQPSDSGPTASVWHTMNQSFSQESDFKFHQAISIGDINNDGTADVVTRLSRGSANTLRILNGSKTKTSFDAAPGQYTNMQVQGDTSGGIRFVPMGKISQGLYPSYWITGQSSSYLYTGGVTGIVGGVPTAFGTGGIPRKFSTQSSYTDTVRGLAIKYFPFSDSTFYNPESVGNLDSTLNNLTPFAHGDFNGDGYEDVAMGVNLNTLPIADLTKTKDCTSNYCGSGVENDKTIGYGRVVIFYGGADNGFQIQPDSKGGYPLNSDYFRDYSADNGTKMDYSGTSSYAAGAPCLNDGTGCKIQVLHENNTYAFGSTVAAVPIGICTFNGKDTPVSALVVQATYKAGTNFATASGSKVYIYKPACLANTVGTQYNSGLKSFSAEKTLADSTPTINPAVAYTSPTLTSSALGLSMVAVGDSAHLVKMVNQATASMNSIVSHLVVSDQSSKRIFIHPVYQFNALTQKNFGDYTNTADGGRIIDYSLSNTFGSSAGSGSSMGFATTMSTVGDLNGDGFLDLAIGMTSFHRVDTAKTVDSQGAILLLFGGPTGVQSHNGSTIFEPTRDAECYVKSGAGGVQSSICNPSLLYLPQVATSTRNGAYERTYLSPFSFVDFGTLNEGLGSFLMGVPGKDSIDPVPSSRILQGGAFYVGP